MSTNEKPENTTPAPTKKTGPTEEEIAKAVMEHDAKASGKSDAAPDRPVPKVPTTGPKLNTFEEADAVRERMDEADRQTSAFAAAIPGTPSDTGTEPSIGDRVLYHQEDGHLPAVIVATFEGNVVALQVFLNSPAGLRWCPAVEMGNGPGCWSGAERG